MFLGHINLIKSLNNISIIIIKINNINIIIKKWII